MMKYFMLMGPVSAGKTSLAQRLNGDALEYIKTQSVELRGTVIDTPGEYIENRSLLRALTVTAADASCIVLIQDAAAGISWYSPAQASMFACRVIGAVTKIDIASSEQIHWAAGVLTAAGAEVVFPVSNRTLEGIEALRDYLRAVMAE